ncbi:hypothetical protein EXIGLDRAFT_845365 [Exidia glandulosa HHB12029]|uniref:DUF7918 domain-containing protein n=1 Tax=Exidia glandulosa HHB12029 TaxID=1314781 RepID=A0A165BHF0_EXIGL|nr:hypothetical protein EXIGLDRAFT_845365 [Exidia glandulosa HHB12029]
MNPPPTSLSHLGFESWVTCEGAPVPVYGVELHGNRATCWIASEAGKARGSSPVTHFFYSTGSAQEFAVNTKMVDTTVSASAAIGISVDGARIDGQVLGTVWPAVKLESNIKGVSVGPSSLQRLKFSSVALSDEDSAMKDNVVLAQLGVIAVQVTRCALVSPNTRISTTSHVVPEHLKSGHLTVHERAKKLGGHHTTLGAVEQRKPRRSVQIRRLEAPGASFLEFEFKYRPKDVLQAQDIIPVERQLPSVPLSTLMKRARESCALDDTTNADRPSKKTKKPKEEPGGDAGALRAVIRSFDVGEPADVKVKVEAKHPKRTFNRDRVIDLTEDD